MAIPPVYINIFLARFGENKFKTVLFVLAILVLIYIRINFFFFQLFINAAKILIVNAPTLFKFDRKKGVEPH